MDLVRAMATGKEVKKDSEDVQKSVDEDRKVGKIFEKKTIFKFIFPAGHPGRHCAHHEDAEDAEAPATGRRGAQPTDCAVPAQGGNTILKIKIKFKNKKFSTCPNEI